MTDRPGPSAVTVDFEGRPLPCRPGTSVAVALWEHGVRVLSHGPRFGRPRGLFCARGHCTSCLMRIDGVPNVRACRTAVRQGMRIERQRPGARHGRPLQRLLAAAEPLLPVGFHFKWFTRPAPLRRLFLAGLRPLTGSGRLGEPETWRQGPAGASEAAAAASVAGPDRFDAVVIGGGLAGLREAARLASAADGARPRVLLVDDHAAPGGQRLPALEAIAGALGASLGGLAPLQRAAAALREAVAAAASAPLERGLGWQAVGAYRDGTLLRHDGRALRAAGAPLVVWAAGALDRLGLFEGNDLPGLLGPRGLYRTVGRDGMDVRGLRAVVCGGGLDLCLAAALLEARGAAVEVVLATPDPELEAAAAARGWPLRSGLALRRAELRGRDRLRLRFGRPGPEGAGRGGDARRGGRASGGPRLDCDLAVVCERGKPAYDLPYQLGCRLVLRPERGGYLPAGAAAGAAAGAPWEETLPGGLRLRVGGEAGGLLPREVLAVAGGRETS